MTLGKGFYRFLGIVSAIVSIVQSVIWIILSLFGIICYHADCGALPKSTPFGRAFNLMYLNSEDIVSSPCIDPIFFHVIMWLYLFISIVWVMTSGYLLYCTWKNSKKHKYSGPIWIIFTLLVCAYDFTIFAIFTVDFHRSLSASNASSANDNDNDTGVHRLSKFNASSFSPTAMERSNVDCDFRRMYDFDNPKGAYTPEEREMIKLSIANEKARLKTKRQHLEQLVKILNEVFLANRRNPLVLPPKFTTAAPVRGPVPNSDDFDSDDLDSDDLDEHAVRHDIARKLAICSTRFRRMRTRIGARLMMAPAATMMTLALRGYVLWVFNICLAIAMWHFYVYKQRESFLSRFSV